MSKLWTLSRFRKPKKSSRRGLVWFPGCCCDEPPPPTPCWNVFDDFNRTNSTTIGVPVFDNSPLGSNWVENSGDWEIQSNRLRISTSDAVLQLLNGRIQLAPGQSARITVNVKASAGGDTIRVYAADRPLQAWGVELEIGTGKVRLIGREGIALTYDTLAQCDFVLATNTFYTLSICARHVPLPDEIAPDGTITDTLIGGLLLTVRIGNQKILNGFLPHKYWEGTGCFFGGPEEAFDVALGTGNTVTGVVEFDDFYLDKSADEPDTPQCEPCPPCCWPYKIETPNTLTVQLFDVGGFGCFSDLNFCSSFAGLQFGLTKTPYPYFIPFSGPPPVTAICAYYTLGGLSFNCPDNDIVYTRASLIVGVGVCVPSPFYTEASCMMLFRLWDDRNISNELPSSWDHPAFQGWQKIVQYDDAASVDSFCNDLPLTLDQIETPFCENHGYAVVDTP